MTVDELRQTVHSSIAMKRFSKHNFDFKPDESEPGIDRVH